MTAAPLERAATPVYKASAWWQGGGRMRRGVTSILALALLVMSSAADADVVPPPDFVESCTLNKVQQAGEQCVVCRDAYHAEPNACRDRLAGEGYLSRCRTAGASVWTEIWCRTPVPDPPDEPGPGPFAEPPPPRDAPPDPQANTVASPAPPAETLGDEPSVVAVAAPAPAVTAPPKSGSCGACGVRSSRATWISALLAAGLGALLWRARRRNRTRGWPRR